MASRDGASQHRGCPRIPAFCLFALLSLGPTGLPCAEGDRTPEPSREGYRLLYFGEETGQEWFDLSLDPESGDRLVTAEGDITLGARSFKLNQKLRVDPQDHTLLDYDLTAIVGGETQSIRAMRSGDSVIVAVSAASGQLRRSYHEPGPIFVLDNLLLNHIALLAERIATEGFVEKEIRIVVPQVAAVLPAKIVPKPPEEQGERLVEIQVAGVTEILRFDTGGKLVSVEVPTQGLKYERIDPEQVGKEPSAPEPRKRLDPDIPDVPATPSRQLFEEETLFFTSRGEVLNGILTLPRGGHQIPYSAVLFVHGSGPSDRDETVGGNRPFRDLAHGLAVFGIASYRYDKRTLAAPHTVDPIRVTVEEEVIGDAVEALETLRVQGGIDRNGLVILGHSLGGGLAATIAKRGGPVAGLVLLSGSPRPLDQLLEDQLSYLLAQAEKEDSPLAFQKPYYVQTLAQIDSLRDGLLPETRLVMGMSQPYLRDYNSRDLLAELVAFPGAVLILQGGKDYQVTRTDFDLWKKAVENAGKANVTTRFFPELGHLFIPIEGDPTPEKILLPGSIDPDVIHEIASFIQSLR
jgi:pimeloyl-ACP methyl ester carboxylesterase